MHIEGILQLLREGLDLGALLQQLPPQAVHFVLQDVNVGHTVLQDVQLPPGLTQLQLQQPQLIQPAGKLSYSSCILKIACLSQTHTQSYTAHLQGQPSMICYDRG